MNDFEGVDVGREMSQGWCLAFIIGNWEAVNAILNRREISIMDMLSFHSLKDFKEEVS